MGWLSPLAAWKARKITSVIVRLGSGKRSPMRKSSNQRCSVTTLCLRGSKLGFVTSAVPTTTHPSPVRGPFFGERPQAFLRILGGCDITEQFGSVSDTPAIIEIVCAHEGRARQ